jgi:hypothetical protein
MVSQIGPCAALIGMRTAVLDSFGRGDHSSTVRLCRWRALILVKTQAKCPRMGPGRD